MIRAILTLFFMQSVGIFAQLNDTAKDNISNWIQRNFKPAAKTYEAMEFYNFKSVEGFPEGIQGQIDSLQTTKFELWKNALLTAKDTLHSEYKTRLASINAQLEILEKTVKIKTGHTVSHQFRATKQDYYRTLDEETDFYEAEIELDNEFKVTKTKIKKLSATKKG